MDLKLYGRAVANMAATTSYWDSQSMFADTQRTAFANEIDLECESVTCEFSRTAPSPLAEDVATFSLWVANQALVTAMVPMTDAKRLDVETAIGTWWASYKVAISSGWALTAYRWHRWLPSTTRPGPAVRTTLLNVPGTSPLAYRAPDQIACSHTFRTASRKHWGRFYAPAWFQSNLSAYGRLTDGNTTTALGYFKTLMESIDNVDGGGSGVVPVIRSKVGLALLSIDVLALDSTLDVIRSRRAKHPSFFATAS
jgi:hypothetical protein